MRILILTQYLAKGGLEKIVSQLGLHFKQRENDVCIAAYECDGLDVALQDALTKVGVDIFVWQKKKGFCWRTVWRLSRILSNRDIEILHTHDLGALIYGFLANAAARFKSKLVHTQHSFVHLKKGKRRYTLYERLFTAFADEICGVSSGVSQTYRMLGVPIGKITVVPNGVCFPNDGQFKSISLKSGETKSSVIDVFGRCDFRPTKRTLLSLGRIAHGKGVEHLIRVWRSMPLAVRNDWQVLFVGPCEIQFAHAVLHPLLEENGNEFIFAGATDSPFLYYVASDAFISLSEEEGMPLAAHEAIGCGLPAFLSDIDGHRSLLHSATLVNLNQNPQDLAFSLTSWLTTLSQNELARDARWQRRADFRSQHTVAAMAERYLCIFARHLRTFSLLVILLFNSVPTSTMAQTELPQITDLTEKPEYLEKQDWRRSLDIRLSTGESTLLTFRNTGLCGALPRLQGADLHDAVSLQWFRGITVPVTKPSFEGAQVGPYTDALVPVTSSLPCSENPEPTASWFFAEIKMLAKNGPSLLSGRLQGTMASTSQRDSVSLSWPLTIQRLPFQFDGRWSLPLRSELIPHYAALAHFGESGLHEGKLTSQYVKSMVEHRVLPLKAWIKHPFLTVEERESTTFSLSRFPHPELSFTKTVLQHLPEWAETDVPRVDSDMEETRASYWSRWRKFLSESLTDGHDQAAQRRLQNRPFVYLWDEPKQSEWPQLVRFARSVKENAPEFRVLITTYPWNSLLPWAQIFAPLLSTLDSEGKPQLPSETELWSYVSCMSHGCTSPISSGEPDFVLERNASYIRVWSWMARHFNLTGVLYYAVNNVWRKAKTIDVWRDIFDFTGNGDGTLFYPGQQGLHGIGEDSPIASLRLKIWRQTSFDAEYIRLAEERHPLCFKKLIESLSPVHSARVWKRDSRLLQNARERLIDCLVPPDTVHVRHGARP